MTRTGSPAPSAVRRLSGESLLEMINRRVAEELAQRLPAIRAKLHVQYQEAAKRAIDQRVTQLQQQHEQRLAEERQRWIASEAQRTEEEIQHRVAAMLPQRVEEEVERRLAFFCESIESEVQSIVARIIAMVEDALEERQFPSGTNGGPRHIGNTPMHRPTPAECAPSEEGAPRSHDSARIDHRTAPDERQA